MQEALRATVLIDPERPKVKESEVARTLRSAGISLSHRNADFGVVVGGDGIFSYYGRLISIPLLFVGVRSQEPTSSRGYLAELYIDSLPAGLAEIKRNHFDVVEYKRMQVAIDRVNRGDFFTDVYLEKGADSNALRYKVTVKQEGSTFTDSAIANGVIVCTSAGSTGYYSYVDKLRMGDWFEPKRYTVIGENEVGVCHIAPVFTSRGDEPEPPLRYTVPWGSTFEISLTRDADARLFGLTKSRQGIRIRVGDRVSIRPSRRTTRVIKLGPIPAGESVPERRPK